jgi:hypothetical protein
MGWTEPRIEAGASRSFTLDVNQEISKSFAPELSNYSRKWSRFVLLFVWSPHAVICLRNLVMLLNLLFFERNNVPNEHLALDYLRLRMRVDLVSFLRSILAASPLESRRLGWRRAAKSKQCFASQNIGALFLRRGQTLRWGGGQRIGGFPDRRHREKTNPRSHTDRHVCSSEVGPILSSTHIIRKWPTYGRQQKTRMHVRKSKDLLFSTWLIAETLQSNIESAMQWLNVHSQAISLNII